MLYIFFIGILIIFISPTIINVQIQFAFSTLLIVFSVAFSRVPRVIPRTSLPTALCLLVPIGILLSSISAKDPGSSIIYSLLLTVKILALSNVVRQFQFEKLINAFCLSSFGIILTGLIFSADDFIVFASKLGQPLQVNRSSFAGYHFNFLGISLGLTACLLFIKFLDSFFSSAVFKTYKPLQSINLLLALLATVSIALTGSRSALLGVLSTCFISLLLYSFKYSKYMKLFPYLVILFFFLTLFLFSDSLALVMQYFSELLQLDSDYRGFDSGFSGRTELWALSLSRIQLLGYGYIEGVTIDNSWVYGALQSGLLSVLPLALFSLFLTWFYLQAIIKAPIVKSVEPAYAFALLVYSLFNSIFNQQLFTLTSPLSYGYLLSILYFQVCSLRRS